MSNWRDFFPAAAAAGLSIIDAQTFLISGTWTKPNGALWVRVLVWSGGQGGSRGDTTSSQASGGRGGGCFEWQGPANALAATESVVVGAGGVGGTVSPVTSPAWGGRSTFGNIVGSPDQGLGGQWSQLPAAVTVVPRDSGTNPHPGMGGGQGTPSRNGQPGMAYNIAGGGAGGSITLGASGPRGGPPINFTGDLGTPGGAGGGSPQPGENGADGDISKGIGGYGGGGGGSKNSGDPGANGGDGGVPGGGGGGGGRGGTVHGDGGRGGDGAVYVETWGL